MTDITEAELDRLIDRASSDTQVVLFNDELLPILLELKRKRGLMELVYIETTAARERIKASVLAAVIKRSY